MSWHQKEDFNIGLSLNDFTVWHFWAWAMDIELSRKCMFLDSLSRHNKDLEQWTLKPLARHSSVSRQTYNLKICMHPYVQFSSVTQSCLTLCDPMNCSMPGLPVHHQLLEFTQIHIHQVSDAFQSSHPLSFPSPPAHDPSQHQSLFQRVNSSHEVAKVLEFQL